MKFLHLQGASRFKNANDRIIWVLWGDLEVSKKSTKLSQRSDGFSRVYVNLVAIFKRTYKLEIWISETICL